MTVSFLPTSHPTTRAAPAVMGDVYVISGLVSLSGNYVTGGDAWNPLVPSVWAPYQPAILMYVGITLDGGYYGVFDYIQSKLAIYDNGGTERAAAAYPGILSSSLRNIAILFAR